MSDFKIIGSTDPIVGKEEFYSVNTFLPSVLPFQNTASNNSFEQPVKWEIHILENGRWRKTKENDKTGKRISYTFLQKSLERKGIRILARRGEDIARLNVTTHPAEQPKIESIELLDKSGKKTTKPLSYGQTLKARVHCLHMEKHKVSVTLWEDDADGAGHNKANEKNIIQTLSGVVKNGIAEVDFLLRPSFAKIANKSKDEGKIHEYYVTTDFNKDKIASNNVNVNDLETPVAPFKGKVPVQQQAPAKPKASLPQPVQPKTKAPASGSSSATQVKPQIIRVHITNSAKQPIKGVHKEKQIIVWVDSKGLVGKDIRLKLYDEDYLSDDLLFDKTIKVTGDIFPISVALDSILRSKGGISGEGAEQEVFADVEVIQTKDHKKSEVVDVDAKVFKPDPVESSNKVAKVGEGDKNEGKNGKKGACDECAKPITAKQLIDIFPKADSAKLEKVAATYTKYMKDLGMDTCWNKAHLFAQARVESGLSLDLKEGEGFNYYYESLSIFKAFQSEEGKEKAKLWGRPTVKPKIPGVSLENQKKIANWAYSPPAKKAKEIGNTEANDGWNYRGRGLVQVTGKGFYEYCNLYTKKNNLDVVKKPDLIGESIELSILSSMIFFKWKNLNTISNKTHDVINKICPKVGNDVALKDEKGNPSSNHKEKQKAFNDITSKAFKIDNCKWGEKVEIPKTKGKFSTYDNEYSADSKTAYINVIVPKDRRTEGLFVFFDDTEIVLKGYALAMGTVNDNFFERNGKGSTPTGLWSSSYSKTHIGEASYGDHGLIHINGMTGDAKKATAPGKRDGIAIHSGHTTKVGINDNGPLMVTYGCVRVYNADMKKLVENYNTIKGKGKTIYVYVEEVDSMDDVYKDYGMVADPKDKKRNYSKNAKQ
ncbi:L,D-transpeptidase family protein [Flavobacterium ginsengiterrae]|uniref:L,D-TPase catalytic domain-containing protein n=1 Tax=Flavobacterium ginsengiterrae TaxID=871695 RepID=A0ABP7GM43_9FLAO